MRKLLARNNNWEWAESAEPIAQRGEALVRVTRVLLDPGALGEQSGVGGAFAPGRDFVGIVQSGPQPLEGKRVVSMSAVPCSACDLCRAGLSIHCRVRSALGTGRDGALAERIALPVSALLEVPKGLDDDRACFAPSLGRALHAADLVRLEAKPYVTILGESPVALLAAQIMTQRNASVRVLGREPARFSLCEKWGVKHRHIDEVGRRADQDVVFVCSSEPGDLEIALRLARPRSTVLLLTGPGAVDHSVLALIHEGEISVIGSRGERLPDALRLLAADSVDVQSLLTARYRFSQFAEALAHAVRRDSHRVLLEAA